MVALPVHGRAPGVAFLLLGRRRCSLYLASSRLRVPHTSHRRWLVSHVAPLVIAHAAAVGSVVLHFVKFLIILLSARTAVFRHNDGRLV
mmetsp:Transcript_21081/g.28334  ORF Transcript_21081/g.28334 Transcript_21081/m.28334 type:complete len:89 (+) Transcript_21081:1648-1914(+)